MGFYLFFLIIPLGLGLLSQRWVNGTFKKASQMPTASGLTGEQVCRRLLDTGGLTGVGVEHIKGSLNDHYDPRDKVMRLSDPVGRSSSIAAVAVAAHETGHAFQDAKGDASFRFRSTLVPVVGFASQAWMFAFFGGVFLSSVGLVWVAVALFAGVVLFSLVTLPVELGASRRAMTMLTAQGLITPAEAPAARKVLTAASFTYVVAALISIIQLVYLLSSQND